MGSASFLFVFLLYFPMIDPDFVKGLAFRFERKSLNNIIQDIQDGEVYRELMQPGGFLRDPRNLSLGFNTDGVSPYKSSSFQMWPIYWHVHDLPPHLRFHRKYNRVCGLWFGKSKPKMNLFFGPFHTELELFHRSSSPLLFFFFLSRPGLNPPPSLSLLFFSFSFSFSFFLFFFFFFC